MMLKVCGLRDQANIQAVAALAPDFVGFIFHEVSPRYVRDLSPAFVRSIVGPKKVGVFVKQSTQEIVDCMNQYGLDLAQLHGDQSAEMVNGLVAQGIAVIKVFRVKDELPNEVNRFKAATYFLFDTLSDQYGGTGHTFDWAILKPIDHPFLLSGGIDLERISEVKKLNHPFLVGVDVNSRFETARGIKDIEKIKQLKEAL